MPQDMGQWGSQNWASNFSAQPSADPSTSSGTPAAGTMFDPSQSFGTDNTPTDSAGQQTGLAYGNTTPSQSAPPWTAPNSAFNSYDMPYYTSFADGGDVTGPVTDPDQAATSVQKALAAGRQSMGIPAMLFGAADDGDGDDDSGEQVAGNIPARPAAPGGDSVDQTPGTKTPSPPFGKRREVPSGYSTGGVVDTENGDQGNDEEGGEQIAGNIPARPAAPGGEGPDQTPGPTKTPKNPFGKRREVLGSAGGGVIDDGDMGDPQAEGMPPQPADNQPTGQDAQVNMQALKQYISGAGAMPADQAVALEQKADPQGQMDPALRKLMAVANAGSSQAQFGLLQHYRQRFNLLNAYAQAAAQGGQGRPADLAESTQAATRAMHNVPTGHSVSFHPAGNGVAVSVKKLGGDRQSGDQQSFDDGGAVQENDPDQGVVNSSPVDTGDPMANALVDTEGGQASDLVSGVANAVLSIPQYLHFLANGNYDALHDKGPNKVVQEAAAAPAPAPAQGAPAQGGPQLQSLSQTAQQASGLPANAKFVPGQGDPNDDHMPDIPGYDKDLIRRAYHATGGIGSPAFYDKLERLTTSRANADNAMTLEQAKADAMAKVWGIKQAGANARNDNTVQGRIQQTMMQVLGRELTAQENQSVRLTIAGLQANPGALKDPNTLMQQLAPLAVKARIDPRTFTQMIMQGAQQGGQAPQGGQPQQTPQPDGGKPEVRYDAQGKAWVKGPNGSPVPYNQ